MNEKYDIAVGAVKEFLELNKYSYHTRAAHMRCYKLLGAHYAEKGEIYSRQTAEEWLRSISPGKGEDEAKVFRRALERLDAAYHYREIGNTSSKGAMRQIYRCLEPWCKALLEEFIEEMSGTYGSSYTKAARISVARFLSRMVEMGICRIDGISHRFVVEYCRDGGGAKYVSKLAGSADKGHIRRFLQYLQTKGLIRASISMVLDQSVFPRLVFIDSLDANDRSNILAAAGSPAMSTDRYYEIVLKVEPLIVQLRYADTAQHTFHMAFKELFVFLEANSLDYSSGVALSWANLMSRYTVQWMSFRRAVMIFGQFLESGRIDPGRVYSYLPDRLMLLPEWCRTDYEVYNRLKEKSCSAASTLNMCKNSCLRLMEYLCSSGVSSWGQVTPEILKSFHRQDTHSTSEGKNAYSSRIRHFLEYLGEIGKVPPAIFLAIPCESARRVNIIQTLSDADIELIYSYRDSADSALQLRDVAMILMGLRMGMRASDITGLKFSDISWDMKSISVQQRKTGSFIKLPMPVDAGNAIFRYIMQGRPDSSSGFVFINHKTPYDRLHRSVCREALRRALPGILSGFHATRRTFATRMLVNNVEAGRIAETLGHADNSNVMKYLSTDSDKMRLCAISLEGIPVKGGQNRE